MLINESFDFLDLSTSKESGTVRSFKLLREDPFRLCPCGVGQKFQFLQVLFGFGVILLLGDNPDQDAGFLLDIPSGNFFYHLCLEQLVPWCDSQHQSKPKTHVADQCFAFVVVAFCAFELHAA